MKKRGVTIPSVLLAFIVLSLLFQATMGENSDISLFSDDQQVKINEVMYAPSTYLGSDNEWIELYNPQNISRLLTNCTLDGKTLPPLTIPAQSYMVFTAKLQLFQPIYPGVNATEVSMSFKNDGDTITLRCGEEQDFFSYEQADGAYRNNFTLERREDRSWGEAIALFGTPGKENSIHHLSSTYEDLVISELFPDPFGSDDELKPRGEWIELFNDGEKTINLQGLVFRDEVDDHELYLAENRILSPNGMLLPAQEYVVIYRDGDSDFALNNDGDETVRLFYQDTLIDEVLYSSATSGMSWSNIEGDFYLTEPTPEEINEVSLDCDWLLSLESINSIYHTSDFTFDIYLYRYIGIPGIITVKGKIEDSFGKVIREYSPWTNIEVDEDRVEHYSPNLPEGIYQISFWIEDMECEDIDLKDNTVTKIIVINPQYKVFSSSLSIDEIYLGSDDLAEWGDQITVAVNVYKGNSTRTAIELWVEQDGKVVSKRSKLNIYEAFQNYTLTLPLQLLSNCDHADAKDGKVTLILEGLGMENTAQFVVQGIDSETCKNYDDEQKKKSNIEAAVGSLPQFGEPGGSLPVTVELNNDGEKKKYDVWAYLYRGKKCYSCFDGSVDNEFLKKTVVVGRDDLEIVPFNLLIDEQMEEGEYKLKVKLKRDDQKTVKELTESVFIKAAAKKSSANLSEASLLTANNNKNNNLFLERGRDSLSKEKINNKGMVIYQSSSEKSKKLIPYFLIGSFLLVVGVVWVKR